MSRNFNPKLSKKIPSNILINLDPEKIDQKGIREGLETENEYSSEHIIIPKKFTSSVMIREHHFTNFLSNDDKVLNDYLIRNWDAFKKDIFDFIHNLKSVYSDTKNRRRLNAICKNYDWDLRTFSEGEAEDIFNIMKVEGLEHKGLNSLRVYVGISIEDKHFTFIFLDPHHLAIPSAHNNLDAETVKQQTFNKCQYYKTDIANLL